MRVRSDIVEHACYTSKALVKVMPLLKGVRDCLQDLLVLLCVCVLHLFGRSNVVFEISASVLPCLQTLSEELGDLFYISTGSCICACTSLRPTSEVSSSGIASSVAFVFVRVGRLLEAMVDVGVGVEVFWRETKSQRVPTSIYPAARRIESCTGGGGCVFFVPIPTSLIGGSVDL